MNGDARGIIGHERQRQRLSRLWRKGRLPSALMFAGDAGIGKSLVAREMFRTLYCEGNGADYGGCGVCRACRLFDAGNFPDFHCRDCLEKDESTAEALRELLYSLHLNAYSGKQRCILLQNTEYLSNQCANLLLKILEEPRPDTYFCLLTSSPSRLPATVLSRCHIWFFDRLSEQQVAEIIERQGIAAESGLSVRELAVLADGTMENITSISALGEDWARLPEKLDAMLAGDAAAAGPLAYELSKERQELRARIRLMRVHARSRMLAAEDDADRTTWSVCVSNLLEAEYLIFERNMGAAYVLGLIFADLADREAAHSPPFLKPGRMIEEIVV